MLKQTNMGTDMRRIILAGQIGLAVRRKRQKLGMTQQQLADAAGEASALSMRTCLLCR